MVQEEILLERLSGKVKQVTISEEYHIELSLLADATRETITAHATRAIREYLRRVRLTDPNVPKTTTDEPR